MHNPDLIVHHVETREALLAVDPGTLARARLVAFATAVIVPTAVLTGLGFGAYNFHPGPPTHPGWAPACFAVYDRAPLFGATAPRMTEEVDDGPIVGTQLFAVGKEMTPAQLERQALRAMLVLFRQLGALLARQTQPLPILPICWGSPRRRRADFDRLSQITSDLSADERQRRQQAFGSAPSPGAEGRFSPVGSVSADGGSPLGQLRN